MSRKNLILIVVQAVLVVAAIIIMVLAFRPVSVMPGTIKRQVNIALFVPQGERVKMDKESVKYDFKLGLVSFTGTVEGIKYVMGEQATPVQFSEIPQYYEKLRDSMDQYGSFDSVNGTVYLTRPKELQGKQAAVLNEKGTLISVRPNSDLSEAQWRVFFNSLVIER